MATKLRIQGFTLGAPYAEIIKKDHKEYSAYIKWNHNKIALSCIEIKKEDRCESCGFGHKGTSCPVPEPCPVCHRDHSVFRVIQQDGTWVPGSGTEYGYGERPAEIWHFSPDYIASQVVSKVWNKRSFNYEISRLGRVLPYSFSSPTNKSRNKLPIVLKKRDD
jgi:hypothetical protein